jgi:16S rRNA (cytidine1402-2'-O)-methyltransferase
MASGLDGQRFAFHGYLPTERGTRREALLALERRSARERATQLWIETPYRAQATLEATLAACRPGPRLALGCDLTAAGEMVAMRPVADWRGAPPAMEGRLAVFALLADADAVGPERPAAPGGPAQAGAPGRPPGSAQLQRRRRGR